MREFLGVALDVLREGFVELAERVCDAVELLFHYLDYDLQSLLSLGLEILRFAAAAARFVGF